MNFILDGLSDEPFVLINYLIVLLLTHDIFRNFLVWAFFLFGLVDLFVRDV